MPSLSQNGQDNAITSIDITQVLNILDTTYSDTKNSQILCNKNAPFLFVLVYGQVDFFSQKNHYNTIQGQGRWFKSLGSMFEPSIYFVYAGC